MPGTPIGGLFPRIARHADKFTIIRSFAHGQADHNKDGGREHWPQLGNLVLAGGGMRMGGIVGESATRGDVPKSHPVSPGDFLATLYQFLGMPLELQYRDLTGRPVSMLQGGKPIAGLG